MASVLLSDVIVPEVYLSYTAVDIPEKTAFFDSGVVVRNAAIEDAFQAGGITAHLPFWNDLDPTVEPNYSTDNPADIAVPNKITSGMQITRISSMNQGYSSGDLVAELAGSNPMQRIRNRFGTYWTRQWQRKLIAATRGVLNANVAANGGDMVVNLAVEVLANVTGANLFSRGAMTSAIFTLGDAYDQFQAIAMHSVVFKRAVDDDAIDFVYPASPDPNLPLGSQGTAMYLGKRVIVDDGMPVIPGTTSGFKYVSAIYGNGAFGYGERLPINPVEVYRRPDEGNGGGIESLWERKSWVIHPFGFMFNSTSVAGHSPTNAELMIAGNWTRVIPRKSIPVAFIITNG